MNKWIRSAIPGFFGAFEAARDGLIAAYRLLDVLTMMDARVWSVAVAIAVLSAGCLFPSMDDLNGTGAAAQESVPGSAADAGTDTPSPRAADGSAPSAIADASTPTADRGAPTFFCQQSMRCALGTEVCCGGFTSTECAPAAQSDSCKLGFLRCSDAAECPTGQSCCGDVGGGGEISTCKTSCGSSDHVLCDPARTLTTCPNNGHCTGTIGHGIPVCE